MSGGPLYPSSAVPVTPVAATSFIYQGAGSTEDREEMLGVADATDVVADVTLYHLRFQLPDPLPSGTGKLFIDTRVNATMGITGLNVSWASVALTESPDDATLQDEGPVDIDASVPTGADFYQRTKLTLDADTLVAGEKVRMNIDVDDSAHTVAAETGMDIFVMWE